MHLELSNATGLSTVISHHNGAAQKIERCDVAHEPIQCKRSEFALAEDNASPEVMSNIPISLLGTFHKILCPAQFLGKGRQHYYSKSFEACKSAFFGTQV